MNTSTKEQFSFWAPLCREPGASSAQRPWDARRKIWEPRVGRRGPLRASISTWGMTFLDDVCPLPRASQHPYLDLWPGPHPRHEAAGSFICSGSFRILRWQPNGVGIRGKVSECQRGAQKNLRGFLCWGRGFRLPGFGCMWLTGDSGIQTSRVRAWQAPDWDSAFIGRSWRCYSSGEGGG